MRHLRYDYIHKLWIIFAPERNLRPSDYVKPDYPAQTGECPFCSGSEAQTPPETYAVRQDDSPPDTPGWQVRVVPNKYPALSITPDEFVDFPHTGRAIAGLGHHEVIVETPEHDTDIPMMADGQVETVLRAYRKRSVDLEKSRLFKYILIFRNFGFFAGATYSHPHSQLIALPVLPWAIQAEVESALVHHRRTGGCWFCEAVKKEIEYGSRVIIRNRDFVVYAPFASRLPSELCIVPVSHSPMFSEISDDQISSLAEVLKTSLRKLTDRYEELNYNFFIHTANPAMIKEDESLADCYHWHIEILPRLNKLGGFEIGAGFYINTLLPETAAAQLLAEDG